MTELNAFREEIRGWLQDNCPKSIQTPMAADEYPGGGRRAEYKNPDTKLWLERCAEKGYTVPAWPKEYGGGGLSKEEVGVFQQEMREINARPPLVGMGLSMIGPALLDYGTEEQKKEHLPKIARGDIWWCQGYSEPGSGSDLASLRTSAVEDGDDFIINGQKIWTSTAHLSQMCFILVRTEPDAPKHQGISYLLMPMDAEGIDRRPIKQMTGDSDFNELFLTDVRIPAENIVGKRGEGWKVANATLGHERGSLADPNVTQNRLNSLIDLMKSETIDGQRVIDKPIFRDRLLSIQGRLMAQQSNALRILSSQINEDQDANLAKSIVKLQGTELRHELEGLAIDAMGELGTLYEDSPHLRDEGAWQMTYMYFLGLIIGGGTNQIQKNIISERALGMPKEPKIQGA